MPKRYKKILQRPGYETQSVTERPSEFYQLELPSFKIPTVTNSEDSVMTGLENRKWRDIWEHKGRVSGVNNTDGSLQEEHPSLFLLPFAPEVMGSGLGLGVLKTLGGYAGSYVGSKIGNEIGYTLDNTFNKQLFEPLGEIVGGFAGFGKGYNLFEKAGMQGALKYLSQTGKDVPRWFMRPELRTNVGRINQKTFFAEDQTPRYNFNQLPGLNKRQYQSPTTSRLEMIPQVAYASEVPVITKQNVTSITDAQWDAAYNEAVKSGNIAEVQRLRDLHFAAKAPNTKIIDDTGMPKEVYHGTLGEKFTIFDSSKTRPDYNYGTSTNMFSDNKNVGLGYANNDPNKLHSVYLNLQNILERDFKGNAWNGSVDHSGKFQIVPEYGTTYSSQQEAEEALQKILDQYYHNNPAKQAEQRHYMYVMELMDPAHPEKSTNAFSDELVKNPTLDGGIVRNVKDYYDLPRMDEDPELYTELTAPHTDYFVKDSRNIKLSDPITYDDSGQIIPLSKRDDFSNPDIRYSLGDSFGYDPEMYSDKPMQIMKDYRLGRQAAWDYLGSDVKKQTDAHNKALFEKILELHPELGKANFTIEQSPQQRAMTPMEKPSYELQENKSGRWEGLDKDGVFFYHPTGKEQGATYIYKEQSPSTDQMYLSLNTDLKDTAFHEYLHRGKVGYGEDALTDWFYQWKMRHLMKPEATGYIRKPTESVNFIEIGRRAGLLNSAYPGPEPAKIVIKHIIDNDPTKGSFLNQTKWETKPKRVWDALQGKYIGLAPIGIGTGLALKKKE